MRTDARGRGCATAAAVGVAFGLSYAVSDSVADLWGVQALVGLLVAIFLALAALLVTGRLGEYGEGVRRVLPVWAGMSVGLITSRLGLDYWRGALIALPVVVLMALVAHWLIPRLAARGTGNR